MNQNKNTIEPARIVDQDVYELMIMLQNCKYQKLVKRMMNESIWKLDLSACDYYTAIDDCILAALAQDTLIYKVTNKSRGDFKSK